MAQPVRAPPKNDEAVEPKGKRYLDTLDPFILEKITKSLSVFDTAALRKTSANLSTALAFRTIDVDDKKIKLADDDVRERLEAMPRVEIWKAPVTMDGLRRLSETCRNLRSVALDFSEFTATAKLQLGQLASRDNVRYEMIESISKLLRNNPRLELISMQKVELRCTEIQLNEMINFFPSFGGRSVQRLYFDFIVFTQRDMRSLQGQTNFDCTALSHACEGCTSLTHLTWKGLCFQRRIDGMRVERTTAAYEEADYEDCISDYVETCEEIARSNRGLVYVDFSEADFADALDYFGDVSGGQCLVQGVISMARILSSDSAPFSGLQHINLRSTALAMTSRDLRTIVDLCKNTLTYLNIDAERWNVPKSVYFVVTPEDVMHVLRTCIKLEVFNVACRRDVGVMAHFIRKILRKPQSERIELLETIKSDSHYFSEKVLGIKQFWKRGYDKPDYLEESSSNDEWDDSSDEWEPSSA